MKAGPHADRSSKASNALATGPVGARLAPQVITMFRVLLASPQRTKLLLLGVALVAVIGATAFGQIRLNAWNRPFYDALARKDLHGFLVQLMVFGVIAGGAFGPERGAGLAQPDDQSQAARRGRV